MKKRKWLPLATREVLRCGVLRCGVLTCGVLACAGCSSPITQARLQSSVEGTFTHLYIDQQALLGRTQLPPSDVRTRASCARLGSHTHHGPALHGPGNDWTCTISWSAFGGSTATAVYDLDVSSDGCYKATGPSSIVGYAALTRPDGSAAINPLFDFDGCFEVI